MYSVRLNKTPLALKVASIWWERVNCVPYDSMGRQRGEHFDCNTHSLLFISHDVKTSLAVAHALKCPRGSKTPAVNPGCVCMADNFVNFSLWFGHVTNTRDDLPFHYLKAKESQKAICVFTGPLVSLPPSTTETHTPRHTNANIRGNKKWLRKNRFFILFIYLKDTEWRERRSLCRRWLLQILIQSLRRSLHELHFWSANKLAFFSFLFFPHSLPSLSISLSLQCKEKGNSGEQNLFVRLPFSSPFLPDGFFSLSPKLNFPFAARLLECFFFSSRRLLAGNSLGNSRLICIIRKPCFPRSMALG